MRCPIETQENAELLLSYSARRLDPRATAILEASAPNVRPASQ